MNKYIAIIELNEADASEFAFKIGVRGFEPNRYICESLDEDDKPLHRQCFSLPKSIDGLPANNGALETDVLKSWRAEQEKIRQAQEEASGGIEE